MIEMRLRVADLAETSFAVSPLQEAVFSLWVWRAPGRQAFHLPWRRASAAAWRECDVEVLDALVSPVGTGLPHAAGRDAVDGVRHGACDRAGYAGAARR
jgi:hypothetical protein